MTGTQVPNDLAELNQWVLWSYDHERRKIPYQLNGKKAASDNPATWTDVYTAIDHLGPESSGIGFVFHADDPYCGVDLDDCLDNGTLKPWAVDIVRRMGGTYGEVSPSGTGLKFWTRATISAASRFKYHDGAIEIYSSGRYFCFTGNRWATSTMEIEDCQETINWILSLNVKKSTAPFSLPQAIPHGTQHNTLISYAASLWGKNLDPDEVRQLTVAASKRCQVVPPEQNAIDIADWIITHKSRGPSKLNGNSPKDYTFESEEEEPDEQPIHFIPWPRPLSEAAFHGPLGELCHVIEPATEADIAAILFQSLVMIGNIFGRTIHFTAESTQHFCNEFVCLVGSTAKGRKGSSFGQVRNVLRQIDNDWNKHRVKSGLTSGEGLIFHVRDEIREIKQVKGQMVEVVTDAGEADKRMLVVEEELSSALKAMAREGNTLSGVLRQAWDSPIVLAPMTKNNRITASNPHISIIGHITKDELHKSLKSVDNTNGSTNRFLWACAKRSQLLPFGGKPNYEELTRIAGLIDCALGWAQTLQAEMEFDSEAAEMWSIVYEELGNIPSGTIGAILSRAEPHVRRIAMIYAALDRSPLVKADHLEAALEIWRYSSDSVRWIFDDATSAASNHDKVQDKVLKAVVDSPEGCNRRHISITVGGSVKSTEIEFHIATLLNLGKISTQVEKRTRKSCSYYYPV